MNILKGLTLVAALSAGGISLAMAQNGFPAVARLAVALARDLARAHHQIPGDESFADALAVVTMSRP